MFQPYTAISRQNILSGQKKLQRYHIHLQLNPLNAELNPICYLLALLGAHHFLHVSRIRVNTYKKGNAIPLQPWTGPVGSRRLRLPDFKAIGTRWW